MKFIERPSRPRLAYTLEQQGIEPLLARLYAARGVTEATELDQSLARLLDPQLMLGMPAAAQYLADAIEQQRRMVIVADYDCDGATACAVGLRAMRALGATQVDFVVPNRLSMGYGLSPAVVDLAVREFQPNLLITVDNGIASVEGVEHARQLGLDVLITDHHLAGNELPRAQHILNPNQPGCPFPSKHIAGVGVMFYLMLATRAVLRARGRFSTATQPRLDTLLDLVALGTVADVVKLDANNRRLVAQGIQRIRAGQAQPGVRALLRLASCDEREVNAADLGFALGPRINAAGRMDDMRIGIHCLIEDEPQAAARLAEALHELNFARRDVEDGIRQQAEQLARELAQSAAVLSAASVAGAGSTTATATVAATSISPSAEPTLAPGLSAQAQAPRTAENACTCLYQSDWHEGVIGIVASRLKDALHRPTFLFTDAQDGHLRGSGRSIEGFHLRDALDWISKRDPALLLRFGGHAMAAGCQVQRGGFERFRALFAEVATLWLDEATLMRRLEVDGSLDARHYRFDVATRLAAEVWGSGFAAPVFCDTYELIAQQVLKGRHLKASVRIQNQTRQLLCWGRTEALPPRARLAYRLQPDRYQGLQRVHMQFVALEE